MLATLLTFTDLWLDYGKWQSAEKETRRYARTILNYFS